MMKLPDFLDSLVQRVATVEAVERIILFGSWARGDNQPRSDIDLAILCPRATPQAWLEIKTLAESANTLYFVDIVRLDEAQEAFRKRILDEGIILWKAPS